MRINPDQLALVTGTSSGIGAALAAELLEAGWHVLGVARRPAPWEHPEYEHVRADLADLEELAVLADSRLVPRLQEPRWTRIGLVNNAGMLGDPRGLEHTDPQRLAHLLAVNVTAPVTLMGVAVRASSPEAWLRIVNVSSGVATHAYPGLGDYGASKAALRMAGRVLGEELRSPDRPGGPRPRTAVLSYEPGVVDTEMQVQARSAPREEAPWHGRFVEMAAQGRLQPAAAVATEITRFLQGNTPEGFTERRYEAS